MLKSVSELVYSVFIKRKDSGYVEKIISIYVIVGSNGG